MAGGINVILFMVNLTVMARVLLLIPSRTYRTHDFMEAASRLGVEVVVGSEHRSALAKLMEDASSGSIFTTWSARRSESSLSPRTIT